MTLAYNYPIFEANQVLTHAHLNKLREYLEQQVNNTRRCLIGTGVACGLLADYDASRQLVSISDGCGVTSAGLLICVENCELPFLRSYDILRNDGVTQTIWEMLDTNNPDQREILNFTRLWDRLDSTSSLTPTSAMADLDATFFDDKVAILYLEEVRVDENNCVLNDCDATGARIDFLVNKLLVTKEDLEVMIRELDLNLEEETTLDGFYNRRFYYEDIRLPRFRSNDVEDSGAISLPEIRNFTDFVDAYNLVNGEALSAFTLALRSAQKTFEPLIGDLYTATDVNVALSALNNIQTSLGTTFSQNYYDLLRTLYKALTEFTDTAFDIMYQCCPVNNTHPYHLLLGEVPLVDACIPSVCRNYFKQPPVYNGMADDRKRARHRFRRLIELINAFYTPAVSELLLTPSKGLGAPLGDQAIPYIFDVVNGTPTIPELWSYDLYRRCRSHLALSFHRHGDEGLADQVARPLLYSLDDRPFLRVEGHLAFELEDTLEQLTELRARHNLCFDILSLSIDGNGVANNNDPDAADRFQASYARERSNFLFEFDNCLAPLLVDNPPSQLYIIIDEIKAQVPTQFAAFNFTNFITTYRSLFEFANQAMYDELVNYSNNPNGDLYDLENQLREICGSTNTLRQCIERAIFQLLTVYYNFLQYSRPFSLSEFAERRSGMEHLGGVYQGGTFILLYQTRSFPVNFSKEVFRDTVDVDQDAANSPTARARARNITTTTDNTRPLDVATDFPISAANFQFQNRDIVIGDFAVPYKCCDGIIGLTTSGTVRPFAMPECMIFMVVAGQPQSEAVEPISDLYNPQEYQLTFDDPLVNIVTTSHGFANLEFRPYNASGGINKPFIRYTLTTPYPQSQNDQFGTDVVNFVVRDVNDNIIDSNQINVYFIIPDGQSNPFANMYGKVTRFGQPLDDVEITLTEPSTGKIYGDATGLDGGYLINEIEFGTYRIRVDATKSLGFPAVYNETRTINQGNFEQDYQMNMNAPANTTPTNLTALFIDPIILSDAKTEDFSDNRLNLRETDESTEASNEITAFFNREFNAAKAETAAILKSKETPTQDTTDLLANAYKVIEGKDAGSRTINTAYNKAIAALGNEMKDTNSRRKDALGKLTVALTTAYLIRVTNQYPTNLAPGVASALSNTAKLYKEQGDKKLNNTISDWADKGKEQLSGSTFDLIKETF